MRAILLALAISAAAPAAAEVTHSIEARFGVAYSADANNPQGRMHALYEGRYTSTFTHQADNGLLFRFEFGIIAGNLDPDRRVRQAPVQGE